MLSILKRWDNVVVSHSGFTPKDIWDAIYQLIPKPVEVCGVVRKGKVWTEILVTGIGNGASTTLKGVVIYEGMDIPFHTHPWKGQFSCYPSSYDIASPIFPFFIFSPSSAALVTREGEKVKVVVFEENSKLFRGPLLFVSLRESL